MRYTPYTEEQIQSLNVMEPGIYRFQVLEVITADQYGNQLRDKNGVDLAKLKLLIWDRENRERHLYTYISGDGNFAYKLRHFAKTIGMIQQYEDGIFQISQTVGKSGNADLVIKKGTYKTDGSGEMWPDRNDVKDFVVTADGHALNHSQPPPSFQVEQSQELENDVPF
ncbi:MAG TPA: hypothetical protein VNU45_17955 [Rummeliibacillus sp.]|nr:hypothetical protein [Rummeliibacillus sp.]